MDNWKGTKGEWRIEKGKENNGRGKLSITTNENNICTIWAAVDDSETIPNAKLIAAAPELLKALQIYVGQIERSPNKFSWLEKRRIAEKSIEKALK